MYLEPIDLILAVQRVKIRSKHGEIIASSFCTISPRKFIFISKIVYQNKAWNISYRTVVTDFVISPKNEDKPAFMFLFTSIKISSQRKQKYECRYFVIFRTNPKIRHDRSIASIPSFSFYTPIMAKSRLRSIAF